jgi:hypothetical protein
MVQMRYMIHYLTMLHTTLERGECHPDWGAKRIAKMEKRIGLKEKLLRKRAGSKPRWKMRRERFRDRLRPGVAFEEPS